MKLGARSDSIPLSRGPMQPNARPQAADRMEGEHRHKRKLTSNTLMAQSSDPCPGPGGIKWASVQAVTVLLQQSMRGSTTSGEHDQAAQPRDPEE